MIVSIVCMVCHLHLVCYARAGRSRTIQNASTAKMFRNVPRIAQSDGFMPVTAALLYSQATTVSQ